MGSIFFQCPKCDTKFETSSDLTSHLLEIHKFTSDCPPKPSFAPKPYNGKCRACNEYKGPDHVCKQYDYLCPECGMTIHGHQISIKRHIAKHKLVTLLKCKVCDFTTLYPQHLKVHEKKHNPEVQKTEICEKCLEVEKPGHDSKHHVEFLKYYCKVCSFGSNNQYDLPRHERRIVFF